MTSNEPLPLKKRFKRWPFWQVLGLSLGAFGLTLVVQAWGWLQPLELKVYDRLTTLQPQPDLDPRILVVTITEADIQALQHYPIADSTLRVALERLLDLNPSLIGLDLFRNVPVKSETGSELADYLRQHDTIVTICSMGSPGDPGGIPAPPLLSPTQVGFAEIPIDPDGVIRRNLLSVKPTSPQCEAPYSFSFLLAVRYLQGLGLPLPQLNDQQHLIWNQIHFPRLLSHTGGYHHADAGGYQILLNYGHRPQAAAEITLTEVLNNLVQRNQVENRIVLLGVQAPSVGDRHLTPFTAVDYPPNLIAGIQIHAHMLSHLLRVMLDQQPLMQYWPRWGEALWLWGWSVGSSMATLMGPKRWGGLIGILAMAGVTGISVICFLNGLWLPVIAPNVAIGVAVGLGMILRQGQVPATFTAPALPQRARPQTVTLTIQQETLDLDHGTLIARIGHGLPMESIELQLLAELPPAPELSTLIQRWRQLYRELALRLQPRIDLDSGGLSHISVQDFDQLTQALKITLNSWLSTPSCLDIERKLRSYLDPHQSVRILIETRNPLLRWLPWHLWQWFLDYPKAGYALSTPSYQRVQGSLPALASIRVLVVLGDSHQIDTQSDQNLFQQIPFVKLTVLNQPSLQAFHEALWDQQGWDLLFYAGHSSSQLEDTTGQLQLNSHQAIPIPQLRTALKQAIEQGLSLAIFNSCDGLGLAWQLADLGLPQLIVMRDVLPDQVAYLFLRFLLQALSRGLDLYGAVGEARARLEGVEDQFPGASWLPVLCQNPAAGDLMERVRYPVPR